MATLIYASNSDGCTGKCDANCYNATCPECDCVCGGRNHGVGIKQATVNTAELADEMIEEYKKRKGENVKCAVNESIFQTTLEI
jgi:hypothetical protein